MGALSTATAFWAFLNAAELLSSDFWIIWTASSLQYLAIGAIPVLWFQFGTQLQRGGGDTKAAFRYREVLFWFIPAVTAALVWTDPWWGLVRTDFHLSIRGGFTVLEKDYGPWFWVFSSYAYVLVLGGTVRVIRALSVEPSQGVLQAWILGGSTLIPLALNLAYITGFWPLPWIDPTPLAFTVNGLLFMLNLARFRFLAILPAALNSLVAGLDHAVLIFDLGGRLAFLNPAAAQVFGLPEGETGRRLSDLRTSFPGLRELPPFSRIQTPGAAVEIPSPDGRRFEWHGGPVERRGKPIAYLYIGHDITARVQAQQQLESEVAARTSELQTSHERISEELRRRVETEERLVHLSLHDPLTGLSNRTLLLNRLELALERYRRDSRRLFVLLFIDFDHFKQVNDSYGHTAGDVFLKESAARILSCVRSVDTVTRLGGDEFVVLLDGVNSREEALEVSDRISADLSVPLRFGVHTIIPSASIGILTATDGYTHPEELLRDADMALYHAKAAGKNRNVEFDQSMRALVQERIRVNTDLRTAILEGQIEVHYQPVVRLSDRAIVGCEALARWRHPQLGTLSPDRFIPLAEESGLIVPLGLLVLREACKTAAQLKQIRPGETVFTAVNVSALQLAQQGFDEVLVSYLDRLGLSPQDIDLEITETSLVQGAEAVQHMLRGLVDQGFRVKLDDFGTGYSSLAYLHRFPIHTIKIDQSFIRELAATEGIVKGIVSLGHELGKEVVAEGVETDEQASRLLSWGCDQGQGYLFGKALPRNRWLELFRGRPNRPS